MGAVFRPVGARAADGLPTKNAKNTTAVTPLYYIERVHLFTSNISPPRRCENTRTLDHKRNNLPYFADHSWQKQQPAT